MVTRKKKRERERKKKIMRWKAMQTNVIEVIFLLSLDHLSNLHPSCSKPFQRARAGTTDLYSAISVK